MGPECRPKLARLPPHKLRIPAGPHLVLHPHPGAPSLPQSLFVELVGRDDLLNAISLNSAAFNLARVGGPSLAGLLVAAVGEGWCFFLNGLRKNKK
ncbi:MAG: MFS transporter [Bryobacteraceae bacterium]|nr:MFS transporter [Bryobacteraceae bacterium]